MRIFYGVDFADTEIDGLFDLARLVLEPDFARKSHPKMNFKLSNTIKHCLQNEIVTKTIFLLELEEKLAVISV